MGKKKILSIIEFIFGLIILFVLIRKIGLKNITDTIADVSWLYVLIGGIIVIIVLILGGWNIKILSACLGYRTKARKIIEKYILCWVIGQAFPVRIFSLSLVLLLKKEKIRLKDGIAITLVDKIITFIVMFLLVIIGVAHFFKIGNILFYGMFFSLFIAVLGVFTFSSRWENALMRVLARFKIKKIKGFSSAAKKVVRCKKEIILNAVLTLIRIFIIAIVPYIILLGLHRYANIFEFFLISVMISTLASLPISAAGLGIREVGAVTLYSSLMHLDPVVITSTYLIFLVLKYALAITFLAGHLIKNIIPN